MKKKEAFYKIVDVVAEWSGTTSKIDQYRSEIISLERELSCVKADNERMKKLLAAVPGLIERNVQWNHLKQSYTPFNYEMTSIQVVMDLKLFETIKTYR